MGECEYRNCGQTVASSVYCQCRADDIMAKTLKPHFDVRSKKIHRPMPTSLQHNPLCSSSRRKKMATYGYLNTSRDEEPDRPGITL